MFDLLTLKNFRKFQSLKLTGIKRFNLVTGNNGSGKTSLLEALFLLCGGTNANLPIGINYWRGFELYSRKVDLIFRYLFNDSSLSNAIVLSARGAFKGDSQRKTQFRRLEISAITENRETSSSYPVREFCRGIRIQSAGPHGVGSGSIQLIDHDPKPGENIFEIDVPKLNKNLVHARFISPKNQKLLGEVADNITQLKTSKNIDALVDTLRLIDPRISSIDALSEGGISSMYVDIGLKNLMSVNYMGDGFLNTLKIAIGSHISKDGVLLIDELEDGLHHSIIEKILNYLLTVSAENNNQVFATTHSAEVVRAFQRIVEQRNLSDVTLLRFAAGDAPISIYDSEALVSARELSLEVR